MLLLAGVVLIYIPRLFVAYAQMREPGGLDNHNPRDQQARLSGVGKRAQGAHLNSIEAFPMFAAGVFASLHGGVAPSLLLALGWGFVGCRLVYIALYLTDKAMARSAVWGLGFACTLGLLIAPLVSAP